MHEAVTRLGQLRTKQFCRRLLLFPSVLVWFSLLLNLFISADCLSYDGLTLLRIKASIISDPLKLLSDWNKDDADPCTWTGVICDQTSAHVISLNLTATSVCSLNEVLRSCGDAFCGGDCSSFQTCPSLSWQNPDCLCFSEAGFSGQMSASPVCLRNGTVLESGSQYNGEHEPCRLAGSLAPAIGNLSYLQILAIPFSRLSGGLPGEIGALAFLEVLDLRGNALSGRIAPGIGGLSRLQVLNLAFNSLEGEIPSEISGCKSLQIFNVAGNMLSGKIPSALGKLPELQILALSFNQLDGSIPDELADACGNLEHLHLDGNFLFGNIPAALGNCSRLKSLVVSSNFLMSPIPAELGQLQMLEVLDVSRNSLAGNIPPELGNCSKLSMLMLTNLLDLETCINRTMVDQVNGYTSKDKGEFNYFSGALPASITSLPYLRVLWAPRAGFLASFPSSWGTCSNLEVLNLGENSFSGGISSMLVRCQKLIYLDLSFSSLEGSLPPELPISCMIVFNVSGNLLSGSFSPLPGNCPTAELLLAYPLASSLYISDPYEQSFSVNIIHSYFTNLYRGSTQSSLPVGLSPQNLLVVHDVSQNNLTGLIPALSLAASLSSQKPIFALWLSQNQFNGTIPGQIFHNCQDFQAVAVILSHNYLTGTLPMQSMQNCTTLRHFDAGFNELHGGIPPEIGALEHLAYLDLGVNNFGGNLPARLGQMGELEYLILAENSLGGTIPTMFGNLTSLLDLDLAGNKLRGAIPDELMHLQKLRYLRLNNNSLSGIIPPSLVGLTSLIEMDVAYNNLSGPLPHFRHTEQLCSKASFVGNPYLQPCTALAPAPSPEGGYVGHTLQRSSGPKLERQKRAVSVTMVLAVSIPVGMTVVCLLLLFCYRSKLHCLKRRCHRPRRMEVVVFANLSFRLTYENVVRATGNFSVDYLIGNGGFGATYKAELMPGSLFAVKRLSPARFQGIQQFAAEIRTLGRIRHAHLVTLIGYHASDAEMFLIYNYLPGGNLESLLHNRETKISWKVRHKIALNVAQALEYLHNGCHPRVLHRDIKPSNILLDNALNAYLSDFGLARLLGASETHATTDVAGTFGYVAPEYVLTGRVSDKADVYSYGVVLLELLSGKKSLDPSFSDHGDGFNLVAWASRLYRKGHYEAVCAPELWEQGRHSELVDTLKLAISCTQDSLPERPTMKEVVGRLKLCA